MNIRLRDRATRVATAVIGALGVAVAGTVVTVAPAPAADGGATTTAYVTDAGRVAVVDTATNTVTDWIAGAGDNPWDIALDPTGAHAYLANQTDPGGSVTVIDTSTKTVTATIPVGRYPSGVAVNPSDTEVYAANRDDHTVSVIDTSSNAVIATITGVGILPRGVVFHPTASQAYVATEAGVSVIDTSTRAVTTTIPTMAYDVILDPSGAHAYASGSDGVSVIDTSTNTVTATIPASGAFSAALTPYGDKLYVTCNAGIAVVDTATNTMTKVITNADLAAYRIAITADGSSAYVTDPYHAKIGIIDTATDTVSATITDAGFFQPLAIAMNGHPQLSAPGAATDLKVKVIKPASVSLTWVDHGQGITDHEVQAFYYTKGSKKTPPIYEPVTSEPVLTGSAAASYVYDNLSTGRTYVFKVAAKNSVGLGPVSSYSPPVTLKP